MNLCLASLACQAGEYLYVPMLFSLPGIPLSLINFTCQQIPFYPSTRFRHCYCLEALPYPLYKGNVFPPWYLSCLFFLYAHHITEDYGLVV